MSSTDGPTARRIEPSGIKESYEITIRNSNSINDAQITLQRGALNIKYGPNGIGKSTIARALTLQTSGPEALKELLPFKHRGAGNCAESTVEGAHAIRSVLTFNESYVSQFAFQPDEVLKDSFEIFINTDEYRTGLEAIEANFESLKTTLAAHTNFEDAIKAFTELRDAFGITKAGSIAKTSRGFKALGVAGKLEHVPEPLMGYKPFLHGTDPAGWISWQSKGKQFLQGADNCPFCASPSLDKQIAERVSEVYESSAVRNMSSLRRVLDELGEYFEPTYREQLSRLTSSLTEPSPEELQFLATLRGQVETLLVKLTRLRGLSFHALRDADDIDGLLHDLKIDLSYLHGLNSESTNSVVTLINDEIDHAAKKIDEIRRGIGEQKTRVARLIRANQDAINEFLASAGYRYAVRIEASADSYRMILEHQDASGHLESAARHLSYGEKNAFALVLFMHHVRRDKPDLVVLDDPVSSFDKTKKFAILHELFHGRSSIRDYTCLLLTHDLEPAIDIVRTGTSSQFQAASPVAHFLSSRAGVVREKPISKSDISTFTEVCDENISAADDEVVKCIYLRRRFELHGDFGYAYNLISSLLHLRAVPDRLAADGNRLPLDAPELALANKQITAFIPGFNYEALLYVLRDATALKEKFAATEVGYEKVQLFRILLELDPAELRTSRNSAFKKFVNETYHIENEYVMQLNTRKFDAVPDYIIAACTELIDSVGTE